jgi:hypothetical protein
MAKLNARVLVHFVDGNGKVNTHYGSSNQFIVSTTPGVGSDGSSVLDAADVKTILSNNTKGPSGHTPVITGYAWCDKQHNPAGVSV